MVVVAMGVVLQFLLKMVVVVVLLQLVMLRLLPLPTLLWKLLSLFSTSTLRLYDTWLPRDVPLEFGYLFRQLLFLVLELPDLRTQLPRPEVRVADLIHLLVSRLELRLFYFVRCIYFTFFCLFLVFHVVLEHFSDSSASAQKKPKSTPKI